MPKIAYWTSLLYPEKEAVSREVFSLHTHFQPSFVYGLSRYYWLKASLKKKYFGINFKLYPFYRLFAPMLEMKYDLNHLIGSTEDWHLLVSLKKKPIVITAALPGKLIAGFDYTRVAHIATECEPERDYYLKQGIAKEKLSVIYPGILLPKKFALSQPNKKFRLLWASAPRESKNWEVRGLHLLFELLKQDPKLTLVIIGRKWPTNSMNELRALIASHRLESQVEIVDKIFTDLKEMYALGDATIAPYKQGYCKPCPNSIPESLAYGKPVLVSDQVGVAPFISREKVGEVFALDPSSFYQALEKLRSNYAAYQSKTQPCAEKYFSLEIFFESYRTLYKQIL